LSINFYSGSAAKLICSLAVYITFTAGLSFTASFVTTSANPTFQFGSPILEKATIHLPNGKKLVIEAINNSAENKYVQSLKFNDNAVLNAWLPRNEID